MTLDSVVQEVSKKEKESFDNLLRRFNKKVQQSGVLSVAKRKQYFERPLSKRDQRISAIRKRARKEAKIRSMYQ